MAPQPVSTMRCAEPADSSAGSSCDSAVPRSSSMTRTRDVERSQCHPREDDAVVVAKEAAKAIDRTPLVRQVELRHPILRELLHHLRGPKAGVGSSPLGQAGDESENVEIRLDQLADARAQNLEHHRSTVRQASAVNLSHRAGGERSLVDLHPFRLQQITETVPQLLLDLLPGDRADFILQSPQLGRPGVGQPIDPRAQELAELDEGRPQLLQRLARPLWRRAHFALGGLVHQLRHQPCRQVKARQHVGEPVGQEHTQDLPRAPDDAQLAEQADRFGGTLDRGHGTILRGAPAPSQPAPLVGNRETDA